MKKIRIILAVSILVFGLTACGKGGVKTPEPTNKVSAGETSEPAQTQDAPDPKETQKDESSVELPLTANFPMFSLYIDGPSYHFIEKGATSLYNVGGSHFIAITSAKDMKAEKTSEVLDVYLEDFKTGVRTNCNGYKPQKFNIKESKEIEIDGINFWRFEGELLATTSSNNETSFYTVGYTFIREGNPFQITGVVVSDEQDQKDIDEITKYVDAMVKTIRDER